MTHKIKPHVLFTVWSPDEAAECLGLPQALYIRLWNDLVPLMAKDFSEVPDNFGSNCLANFWDKLTEDEQTTLNAVAVAHENECTKSYEEYVKSLNANNQGA